MTWQEWKRGTEIEPSLYAANFAMLGDQIELLCRAGCRIFHFDVGDGHFVEPVTMGPIVLESISPLIHRLGGVIDVHLMVENPSKYFEPFAAAGADSVTFHYEAAHDVPATIRAAREQELQVGLAFNPESTPKDVAAVSPGVDFVLCMSIHPGYSGQQFQERTYERVKELRGLLPAHVFIQVDGGVNDENIKQLYDNGTQLFVGGASIFGHEDLPRAYRRLVQALV